MILTGLLYHRVPCPFEIDCRVGLVVKASSLRAADPGFECHLHRDYSGLSHTGDLKFGTPVAALPGAWCYWVSAGTGWTSVRIWVRKKVWSATSVSEWQQMKCLSRSVPEIEETHRQEQSRYLDMTMVPLSPTNGLDIAVPVGGALNSNTQQTPFSRWAAHGCPIVLYR